MACFCWSRQPESSLFSLKSATDQLPYPLLQGPHSWEPRTSPSVILPLPPKNPWTWSFLRVHGRHSLKFTPIKNSHFKKKKNKKTPTSVIYFLLCHNTNLGHRISYMKPSFQNLSQNLFSLKNLKSSWKSKLFWLSDDFLCSGF